VRNSAKGHEEAQGLVWLERNAGAAAPVAGSDSQWDPELGQARTIMGKTVMTGRRDLPVKIT